jgi:hypothetical protein
MWVGVVVVVVVVVVVGRGSKWNATGTHHI